MSEKKLRLEITQEEFKQLCVLALNHTGDPEFSVLDRITNSKLNDIIDRKLYSQYLAAPTQEERDKARQEYLNRRNIPQDFRW